jgi:hypothetical protein
VSHSSQSDERTMSTAFSEALTPVSKRMLRPARDIEVLRVAAQLQGEDFSVSAPKARMAALAWATKRAGGSLPDEAWKHQDFELLIGGRNSAAVRFTSDTADLWALRAEDPDKAVAGRVWTTEMVIGGENGRRPQLSLRLIVSTTEDEFSIEPHVPGTVLQLIDAPGLVHAGRALCNVPIELRNQNDAEDLCDHLEDPHRRLPVIVVSLPEVEGEEPSIRDADLARATAGLARVVRLPARLTTVLTQRFGKFRSVFHSGVRVYEPGFSSTDDPFRHRLFLGTSLRDSVNAASCAVWLRRRAAALSISTTRLGTDIVEFAAVRTAARRLHASSLEQRHAPDAELLQVAQQLNEDLEKQLAEKEKEIGFYLLEATTAEERANSAEQEKRALLFKLRQLQETMERGEPSAPREQSLPTEWSTFTDWLDQTFPDRIVLTPAARRMVRNPEFEDVGQVARSIVWLATAHYERRINGGGTIRDEQVEAGVINSLCGGDTYETFWQGRRYEVDQHIKSGGNTHDPKRCLRIYYFWEPDQQQTVVDHLPSHRLTNAS